MFVIALETAEKEDKILYIPVINASILIA